MNSSIHRLEASFGIAGNIFLAIDPIKKYYFSLNQQFDSSFPILQTAKEGSFTAFQKYHVSDVLRKREFRFQFKPSWSHPAQTSHIPMKGQERPEILFRIPDPPIHMEHDLL